MTKPPITPRLHILIAQGAPTALIICRARAQEVAFYEWSLIDHTVTLGQWLKGKVYEYRCDISPNGKYTLYFAMKSGKPFSVLSKVPYFTALDFYSESDTWNQGGLFLDDYTYTLNYSRLATETALGSFQNSGLKCLPTINPSIGNPYIHRALKRGWINKVNKVPCFTKTVNAYWRLEKSFLNQVPSKQGRSFEYEQYALINDQINERIELNEWEWADVYGDHIYYAALGKLWAVPIKGQDIFSDTQLIYDFNGVPFEERTAPY